MMCQGLQSPDLTSLGGNHFLESRGLVGAFLRKESLLPNLLALRSSISSSAIVLSVGL